MTSKVLYLVPCFLFAYCVSVSAIEDHFEVKMVIQTRSSAGFTRLHMHLVQMSKGRKV